MTTIQINGDLVDDIDLIIFDKDGTLFELYPYWVVVATKRAENICRNIGDSDLVGQITALMGVNNQKRRMDYNGAIGRLNRKEIQDMIFFHLEGRGIPVTSKAIEDAFAEADQYIAENDEVLKRSLVPVSGMVDLLSEVTPGSKCVMFSHDRTSNLERIARIADIDRYFSAFVGGDLTRYPKPSPLDTIRIIRDLDTSPRNTMFVGDTINDMYSGRDAGCGCLVAVRSDVSDISTMSRVADFIIDDFTGMKVKR